jgi:hypothetical protein
MLSSPEKFNSVTSIISKSSVFDSSAILHVSILSIESTTLHIADDDDDDGDDCLNRTYVVYVVT